MVLTGLPSEILDNIMGLANPEQALALSNTCHQLNDIGKRHIFQVIVCYYKPGVRMSPLILADLAHEIPGSIVRQPFQRGILVLRSPNPGQLFAERPRTKCSVSSAVAAHRSPCQEVGALRRVVCEPPSAPARKQPFRIGNGILYIHYSDFFHRAAGSN